MECRSGKAGYIKGGWQIYYDYWTLRTSIIALNGFYCTHSYHLHPPPPHTTLSLYTKKDTDIENTFAMMGGNLISWSSNKNKTEWSIARALVYKQCRATSLIATRQSLQLI